uniref:Uncharacterized protein n=1 Tax=Cucumis melo TaxID=3656 RepID=A0A9I9EJS9_CUCME
MKKTGQLVFTRNQEVSVYRWSSDLYLGQVKEVVCVRFWKWFCFKDYLSLCTGNQIYMSSGHLRVVVCQYRPSQEEHHRPPPKSVSMMSILSLHIGVHTAWVATTEDFANGEVTLDFVAEGTSGRADSPEHRLRSNVVRWWRRRFMRGRIDEGGAAVG